MSTSTESRREALATLRGAAVFEVRVRYGRVEVLFDHEAMEQTFELSINRRFAFQVHGKTGSYDPTLQSALPDPMSGQFLALIGRTVASGEDTPEAFQVTFTDGSRLTVPLEMRDFEPVIFTGWKRNSNGLAFMHVW